MLLILAMAIMAVGIIFGVSRAPWIGAALAFIVIFIKHPQSRPLMLVGVFIIFVAGIGISIVLADHLGQIVSRVFDIGSLQGRAAAWATAVNMVSDHLFFGVGFGSTTYADNKAEYITGIGSLSAQYAVFHQDMHNEAYTYTRQTLGYPAPEIGQQDYQRMERAERSPAQFLLKTDNKIRLEDSRPSRIFLLE